MNDIHNIKPLIDITVWDTKIPWVLLLFFIFLLIYGFLYIHRTYSEQRNKKETFVVPTESLLQIVERYTVLINSKEASIDTTNLQILYLELTELVKKCLTEVYKVSITNMTTKEITHVNGLPEEVKDATTEFLINIDKLKFSDEKSTHKTAKEMYFEAKKILQTIKNNIEENDNTTTV